MKAILSVLLSGILSLTAAAQNPLLNSNTTAQAVVFLDFDGQTVQGTGWNWSGPIHAQPSGLSAAAITEIFERVAEDYRIFNLNITTDSSYYNAAPATKRARIIITPTWQWYGTPAGGVAYVGSFTWGDDTPGWVFSGLLNNNVKNIAEAASHEAGHTLGLQHQSLYDGNCNKTAEYFAGQGSGEISWAPIMGVGYNRNITTWHNGPNAFGCNYLQNDIDLIAGAPNNIGLRTDDHSNQHEQATDIQVTGNSFVASGIINSSSDKDVFSLILSNSTNLKLSAIPKNVGGSNLGANVDLRVCLLDRNGDTLNRYNPSDLLNAGIDTTLAADNYYISVEGTGNANLQDYGSLGFYSINGTVATTLPLYKLNLGGSANNGVHQLYWSWEADEAIKHMEVLASQDGIHFSSKEILPAGTYGYRVPATGNTTWYKLKITMVKEEKVYYSNIISLKGIKGAAIRLQSNIVKEEILLSAATEGFYQLIDQQGRLIAQGIVTPGQNRLPARKAGDGLLFLHIHTTEGNTVHKLIKQ